MGCEGRNYKGCYSISDIGDGGYHFLKYGMLNCGGGGGGNQLKGS